MAHSQSFIVNGSFEQTVSPLDRGLAYGDGVFRTLIMRNRMPECWPQHYQKLVADCAMIKIVCPSAELLMSDLQQLFMPDETAIAKIIITRGEGERGYAPPAVTSPMRVVVKSKVRAYPDSYFNEGVNLHVCKTPLASQPLLAGVKHLNRLENVLARMEWTDPSIMDGIMLDDHDQVIECTAANIFVCFGDTLITPKLDQCGIAGVTRQRVIDLGHLLGLTVNVENITLPKLLSADVVIITNSIYGALQAKSILQIDWSPTPLAADIRKILKV
jgi:4-amino-4-deoxychorismate lyase